MLVFVQLKRFSLIHKIQCPVGKRPAFGSRTHPLPPSGGCICRELEPAFREKLRPVITVCVTVAVLFQTAALHPHLLAKLTILMIMLAMHNEYHHTIELTLLRIYIMLLLINLTPRWLVLPGGEEKRPENRRRVRNSNICPRVSRRRWLQASAVSPR